MSRHQPRRLAGLFSARTGHSLNHLVGALLEKPGHVEAERLGCLEIDDQLELDWRLHRKIGRLLASKDTVDVSCRWAPLFNLINSRREKAARSGEKSERIDRR